VDGPQLTAPARDILELSRRLVDATANLAFAPPVAHVYRPLEYAWDAHAAYIRAYAGLGARVLLVGMNPGPHGMCQTGVPFGDVGMVRDWLGIEARIRTPATQHPRRPVLGFETPRGEVSGRRVWGRAAARYGEPRRLFARFFIWNYCPLAFLEEGGRNRTPDKLPAAERSALLEPCDAALRGVADALGAERVLGIGNFAAGRARAAFAETAVALGRVPHPSPASPLANRDWPGAFERALADNGVTLPLPGQTDAG
jgi:single-strand selective monofunctional uracil DNA glycosylase